MKTIDLITVIFSSSSSLLSDESFPSLTLWFSPMRRIKERTTTNSPRWKERRWGRISYPTRRKDSPTAHRLERKHRPRSIASFHPRTHRLGRCLLRSSSRPYPKDDFLMHLGRPLAHFWLLVALFGLPLGWFWLPLGSLLVPFGSRWLTFGSRWLTFGSLLAPFGSLLAHFWCPLAHFWCPFLHFCSPRDQFSHFCCILSSFFVSLGIFHENIVQNLILT